MEGLETRNKRSWVVDLSAVYDVVCACLSGLLLDRTENYCRSSCLSQFYPLLDMEVQLLLERAVRSCSV